MHGLRRLAVLATLAAAAPAVASAPGIEIKREEGPKLSVAGRFRGHGGYGASNAYRTRPFRGAKANIRAAAKRRNILKHRQRVKSKGKR